MNGYIKISRELLDLEWYKDINSFKLFMHLILEANETPVNRKGITIPRGSVAKSYSELAEETGLSRQNVRTSLKKMKLYGEIEVERSGRLSIFKVNNYNKYHISDCEDFDGLYERGKGVSERKSEQNAEDKRNTCGFYQEKMFDDFWSVYPRKEHRDLSKQEYIKMLSSNREAREEDILEASKNYKEHCEILRKQEKFIYMAHNWIKNNIWVDFLPENYKRPDPDIGSLRIGTKFNNFEQREYDFEELEMDILESQKENE